MLAAVPSRSRPSRLLSRSGHARLLPPRLAGRRPRPARRSTSTPGFFPPLRTSPIAVQPSGRRHAGRERRDQGVVLPAGQHPRQRIDAQRGPHLLERARRLQAGALQRRPVEVDDDAAVRGDVPEVGEQPVAHVAHRRRAGLRGGRPGRVRRGGTAVRRHHRDRAGEPPAQHGEAARRPAQPPGQRHHVPGTGAGPQHRGPAAQIAQRGHREHHGGAVGGRRRPGPRRRRPRRAARTRRRGPPPRPPATPSGCSAGRPARPAARSSTPPIAATSARFAAAALWPMSSAEDQSRRKCRPSTRTSVVATTRPSDVRSDGGVVARPDLGGPRGAGLGEHARDHAELPDDADGVGRITAGNERAGASHRSPSCRWGRLPNCPPPGGTEPAVLPEERSPVVHAYILIQTEVGKAAQVAATIARSTA